MNEKAESERTPFATKNGTGFAATPFPPLEAVFDPRRGAIIIVDPRLPLTPAQFASRQRYNELAQAAPPLVDWQPAPWTTELLHGLASFVRTAAVWPR